MAIRIPWDEYEAAILILACVDYNGQNRCKNSNGRIDNDVDLLISFYGKRQDGRPK